MIKTIQLNNFRSYSSLNIELTENINIFIGKNGQGKTNLLEAIYFISNIRSHRTRDDLDLIKKGETFSRIIIETEFPKKDKIMSVIHEKGKYFTINDNPIKTTSEMLGRVNTVLFYPTETRLFSDSPSVRRSFFDVEIGKVSKTYTTYYQYFNNILKDRNKLLKSDPIDNVLLDILNQKLSQVQVELIKEREYLIKYINKNINEYLIKLSRDDLKIHIEYKSTLKNLSKEDIFKKYKSLEKRDIFNKVTGEGIHRDDYVIYSNGIEVDKFLSQGQIRLVLLSIKLVLVEYIYAMTKQTPILLLDDVLSELDKDHQLNLLKSIPNNVQTIITTTDDYEIFDHQGIKKFMIKDSNIVNKEELDVRY